MNSMNDHEVSEVRIQTPNGIISGKWWNDKSTRPFLCIHGSLDNAGTFDRLIPLLPKNHSYLAIDMPGHGYSYRFPDAIMIHAIDFIQVITHICNEYKWNKVSFIGHSMGARISYVYAGIFPERVDMLINIDVLKLQVFGKSHFEEIFRDSYRKLSIDIRRNQEGSEPPAYTISEMIDRLYEGSSKSVPKQYAHYLLERNIKPSEKFPEKFYFARDRRLQYNVGLYLPQNSQLEMAKRITMPFLYVNASNSYFPRKDQKHHEEEALKVLKKHPNFNHQIVQSNSHHLHITEAEEVASIIGKFIEKHKHLRSHL